MAFKLNYFLFIFNLLFFQPLAYSSEITDLQREKPSQNLKTFPWEELSDDLKVYIINYFPLDTLIKFGQLSKRSYELAEYDRRLYVKSFQEGRQKVLETQTAVALLEEAEKKTHGYAQLLKILEKINSHVEDREAFFKTPEFFNKSLIQKDLRQWALCWSSNWAKAWSICSFPEIEEALVRLKLHQCSKRSCALRIESVEDKIQNKLSQKIKNLPNLFHQNLFNERAIESYRPLFKIAIFLKQHTLRERIFDRLHTYFSQVQEDQIISFRQRPKICSLWYELVEKQFKDPTRLFPQKTKGFQRLKKKYRHKRVTPSSTPSDRRNH